MHQPPELIKFAGVFSGDVAGKSFGSNEDAYPELQRLSFYQNTGRLRTHMLVNVQFPAM